MRITLGLAMRRRSYKFSSLAQEASTTSIRRMTRARSSLGAGLDFSATESFDLTG